MFTSKWVMGVMLVGSVMTTNSSVDAQSQAKTACIGCDVTFSFTTSADGSRLEAVGSGGVAVEKRMSREGLSIRLSAPGDEVNIVAKVDGTIAVSRARASVTVRPDSVLSEYDATVRQIIAGSAAVTGLEQMVLAVRHNERPEALSMLASFALLRSLQGDNTGNTLLAERTAERKAKRGTDGFLQVRQPSRGDGTTVGDCWEEYEQTLWFNHQRYSRCLRDYWWLQPVQYACALEFAMVAELAMFRVISCSGGFPIG